VVLVGGGYVTLHAYRAIVRRLRGLLRAGHVEIVVISADDAHSFHGFTGEVLAGLLPLAVTRTPLEHHLTKARVVHGLVTHVDTLARRVTYRRVDGAVEQLRYDELVVGSGGQEPLASVPGLAEHGHGLRRPGEIEALASRVSRLRAGAPSTGKARPPRLPESRHGAAETTVLVAGGGLAGVELAAAIADGSAGALGVVLVHAGSRLVPGWAEAAPKLARYAGRELARLGVDVRLDTRIVEVQPGCVRLSDGSTVAAGTVLGTIGQRAVQLPGLAALDRDPQGRLITDEDLSVVPGLWAAGDSALVRHPVTGEPVPTNALWAIKAGAHAGRNVARTLRGRPTVRFRYRGLGQAASFGLGRSAAELYGVTFTGVAAWLLRLAFFLRFMPSRRNALSALGHTSRTLLTRQRLTTHTPTAETVSMEESPGAAEARPAA
jgi:NADH dehydrogenase